MNNYEIGYKMDYEEREKLNKEANKIMFDTLKEMNNNFLIRPSKLEVCKIVLLSALLGVLFAVILLYIVFILNPLVDAQQNLIYF